MSVTPLEVLRHDLRYSFGMLVERSICRNDRRAYRRSTRVVRLDGVGHFLSICGVEGSMLEPFMFLKSRRYRMGHISVTCPSNFVTRAFATLKHYNSCPG